MQGMGKKWRNGKTEWRDRCYPCVFWCFFSFKCWKKSPLGGCVAPHYSTSHHRRAAFGGAEASGSPNTSIHPHTSQHGGRSDPTRGVSPPGSSTNCPHEKNFSISFPACKSGAFQEFLWGVTTCGLGSANFASPQLAGLDAREMFRFLLCCETVMATRSHSAPQGEQTTELLLRGLSLVYFCFSKGENTPLHSGDPCGDERLHRAHVASSRVSHLQTQEHLTDVTPISQRSNWVYKLLFPIC